MTTSSAGHYLLDAHLASLVERIIEDMNRPDPPSEAPFDFGLPQPVDVLVWWQSQYSTETNERIDDPQLREDSDSAPHCYRILSWERDILLS